MGVRFAWSMPGVWSGSMGVYDSPKLNGTWSSWVKKRNVVLNFNWLKNQRNCRFQGSFKAISNHFLRYFIINLIMSCFIATHFNMLRYRCIKWAVANLARHDACIANLGRHDACIAKRMINVASKNSTCVLFNSCLRCCLGWFVKSMTQQVKLIVFVCFTLLSFFFGMGHCYWSWSLWSTHQND